MGCLRILRIVENTTNVQEVDSGTSLAPRDCISTFSHRVVTGRQMLTAKWGPPTPHPQQLPLPPLTLLLPLQNLALPTLSQNPTRMLFATLSTGPGTDLVKASSYPRIDPK